MRMIGLRAIGSAIFCILPASVVTAQQPSEQLRGGESVVETSASFPGAEPLDPNGEETIWCVRIVDALDKQAIPGALVQVPWHPVGGVVASDMHFQCGSVADEYGWARLPWAGVHGYRDYVFADSPGYAANEQCSPGETLCELLRGVDVPVQVVDNVGRPVPDARVELVLGCGHVPRQRTANTDGAGRAVLTDIDPERHEDLFVWARGQQFGEYRLRATWREGGAPIGIDVVPGVEVGGRVLDATGQPVPNVRVGWQGHWLPWVRTDRAGAFDLHGVEAWSRIEFVPPPELGISAGVFTAPPPGQRRTVVLGQREDGATLVVQAVGEKAAAAFVRITAVRERDGLTATATTDERGNVRLDVAPGHYRVIADGELGIWGRTELPFEVGAGEVALRMNVPRNPTVRVDASRVRGMTVGISTATCYRQLDPVEIDDSHVPVPRDEHAAFRISGRHGGELLVHFVKVPEFEPGDPERRVVLTGPPLMHVRARFVGPDGRPVRAHLTLQREVGELRGVDADAEYASSVVVSTPLRGRVTWWATTELGDLGPLFGDVVLTDDDVDLGELRFVERVSPRLRLELPEDVRERHFDARIALLAERKRFSIYLDEGFTCEETGTAGAGDIVQLACDDRTIVPFCSTLGGSPPWTVPWPTAELSLTLRGADGSPLTDGSVLFDGHEVPLDEGWAGRLRLRAIRAGSHVIVVAQRDHLAKIYTLQFGERERRLLDVQLSKRER